MTTEFATPVFGIKAKRTFNRLIFMEKFATPVFGIKAKLSEAAFVEGGSLPPRFWNQGKAPWFQRHLCPAVCHPRFWNQGKAIFICNHFLSRVCHPRFWNQGKAEGTRGVFSIRVCHPRFWNQGKATKPHGDWRLAVCHPRFWNQGKASTGPAEQTFLSYRFLMKNASHLVFNICVLSVSICGTNGR